MPEFLVGATVTATFLVQSVDPVTGAKTPEPSATPVTIRFKNPDGTVLATRTLGGGVTNAGSGYYHGSAVPTVEGLHEVELEVGVAPDQGRDQVKFGVSPF